ncbi:LmeA family phospholipid-binding protein [Actinoplanes sp. NPDC051343]|uniref:LmeA family phospholipid-binding protein n=1 Tax=Actinoplanes sp. NPDC051343 TaxID=3363906 RepID=UPI0037B066DF
MNDDTVEFRALRGGPRRWILWSGGVLAFLAVAAVVLLTLPVPGLQGYLVGQVSDKVAAQMACPGVLPAPPSVHVGGGRLVPQVLRGRFSEITVAVPDVTLSGVPHASFAATMRDVRSPSGGVTHVGAFDGTIKVGFRNLPAPSGTTFARASDGTLTARTVVPASASDQVKAKLFLSMRISGETAESVPSRLQIFGRTLPAGQVGDLAGGVRRQQLPHLPDGVTYRSIEPRSDGVHVSLAGVSTTTLSTLPASVGGHDVTYSAADGLLDIHTSIIKIPVAVIRTRPVLSGGSLTLQPTAVHALGSDHATNDPLARLVLSQVDRKDLTRALPVLPAGVVYRSVAVDPAGIHVTIGGTTVKPFSSLPQDAGHPAVFGAADGLLTATATGSGAATPIVLHSRPVIHGRTLDLAPSEVEMFGTRFPAADVLSQVKGQQTAYPLQAPAKGLAYAGVSVLADGLLIHLTGRDADLPRGSLTPGGC